MLSGYSTSVTKSWWGWSEGSHNSSSRYRHGCLPYVINLLHLHPFNTETARPTKHIRFDINLTFNWNFVKETHFMSYLKRCRVEHLFSILTVIEECVIRCQALHVISNLIQHQLSDIWRKRELWLIRQYTDFLRDLSRYSGTGGGGL